MKSMLAILLLVAGLARAEMSSVQLFYVTSSTQKYHSTADFFDGNAKALRVMSVGGTWGATAC